VFPPPTFPSATPSAPPAPGVPATSDSLSRWSGELATRLPNHGLPGSFYNDPDLYQIDLEAIWYKEWVFAGHDAEILEAGEYITIQLGAYPIILIRGRDGEVRAFHNVCRHRGFKICDAPKGKVKRRLACPYHQWTYDINDGSLSFARDFNKEEGFSKEHYSLKPVALERAGGYMFINVAEEPRPFTEGGALDRYLAPFQLEKQAKVAHQTNHVLKGNWKMVWENNRQRTNACCKHASKPNTHRPNHNTTLAQPTAKLTGSPTTSSLSDFLPSFLSA